MSKLPRSHRFFSLPIRSFALTGSACALLLAGLAQPALAASNTTTTLTFNDQTINAGVSETLTATVKVGSTKITTGLVNFYDTTDVSTVFGTTIGVPTLVGTGTLTASGTAVIAFKPSAGNHYYQAAFQATTANNGSTSSSVTSHNSGNKVAVAAIGSYVDTGVLTELSKTSLSYAATFFGKPSPTGTITLTQHGSTLTNGGTVSNSTLLNGLTPSFSASGTTTADPSSNVTLQTATGDFNNDGIPDFVVSNVYSATISVFIGNGDGTFKPAVQYTTDLGPYALVIGDFDGDGYQDIAVSDLARGVSVLLNKGTSAGTFAPAVNYATGKTSLPTPYGMVAADVNNDGILDLVTANEGEGTISVLIGKTDGTFTPATAATTYTVGADPFALAVADFNQDGNQDVLVLNSFDGTVGLLKGTGTLPFGATSLGAMSIVDAGNGQTGDNSLIPYAVTVGDFNADGLPDVAIADLNSHAIELLTNKATTSHGTTTYSFTASHVTVGNGPISIAVLNDLDGSGNQSLAVANYVDNTITVLYNQPQFFGSNPSFTTTATIPGPATAVYSISTADFNGDGAQDLVTANFGGNHSNVYLGTQIGTFTATNSSNIPTGTALKGSYVKGSSDPYVAASSTLAAPLAVVAPLAVTTLTTTVVTPPVETPAASVQSFSGVVQTTRSNDNFNGNDSDNNHDKKDKDSKKDHSRP